jgi:hypothetical protein
MGKGRFRGRPNPPHKRPSIIVIKEYCPPSAEARTSRCQRDLRGCQIVRGTGLERLGALQQQYIRVCENQVVPPVPPDLAVLEGLSHKRLSTNLDNSSKEALRALALFLDSEEARHKLQCVYLKAGEPAKSARNRNSDGGSMLEKRSHTLRSPPAWPGGLGWHVNGGPYVHRRHCRLRALQGPCPARSRPGKARAARPHTTAY